MWYFDVPALRQLQYILFEGLSNVLQHSGATRLTLSARRRPEGIELLDARSRLRSRHPHDQLIASTGACGGEQR